MMSETQRPFMSRFAVDRHDEPSLPGFYSRERKVWVLPSEHGLQPIVYACRHLADLETKTKVRQEEDDEHPTSVLREAMTKTEVRSEQDEPTDMALALELVTKTNVRQETDD